jgi:hypoxanthine-DNA glycosylase
MRVQHPWGPVFDAESQVLILGSLPSPASRSFGFYYGHPQNLFWKTLAGSLRVDEPAATVDARREFLLANRVALWDSVAAADIEGAADATLHNVVPNDFSKLLAGSQIQAIFGNGRAATNLFNKYSAADAGMQAIYLPSTSPANRFTQAKPEFAQRWAMVGQLLRGNQGKPKDSLAHAHHAG